jgi:translation initiation factor IF-3
MAKKQSLDIIEVAPTAEPPVCRLLDYGRYKYEQAKKERELRRSQKVSALREVRLRPRIGGHDFEAKARTASKLLGGGDKVKVTILFRGREVTHPENGWKLLRKMGELLQGEAAIDSQPAMEGRRMSVVFSPVSTQKIKEQKGAKEP